MFIQTQKTPNPNSLKFLPGKKVSNDGPCEILSKEEIFSLLETEIKTFLIFKFIIKFFSLFPNKKTCFY